MIPRTCLAARALTPIFAWANSRWNSSLSSVATTRCGRAPGRRGHFRPLLGLLLLAAASGLAAQEPDLAAILKRLEQVERDNQGLREELRQLRQELGRPAAESAPLAERVEVQEHRIEEQAQSKVEASQKMPLTLTGMLLFNAFHNGRQSGTFQYPTRAQLVTGPSSSAASLRQTVLGLKFQGPGLPGGGTVSGTFYMDFFAGTGNDPFNHLLHIRTATVDLNWNNTTLSVGQDKPIFAPREPDSLAQVGISPLTSAGNLWDWQPQIRLEHRWHFGEQAGLRAQGGVYLTSELDANVPALYARTLERARPGYEGRAELWAGNEQRRIEIAPGFQLSSTHVAGTTVPSRLVSMDWLIRPAPMVDLTGAWFRGQNVANTGALRQGFSIRAPGIAIPVHSQGGWAQVTWRAAPRLTFHLYGGQQHDRAADLLGTGVSRNFLYAGNWMYRLAPNVIASFEASQVRTTYLTGRLRLNNHYDLALAYLF